MHWAAFTLIIRGQRQDRRRRRRISSADDWQRAPTSCPPDLTKNWLVHGADHRGARADWNPVCRRYEARTPPLAAAAARLRSRDQSIKRGPAPTEEPRVAQRHAHGRRRRVRTTWARYCRNVVPACGPGRPSSRPRRRPGRTGRGVDQRAAPRDARLPARHSPGEQKRGPRGARAALLRLEAGATAGAAVSRPSSSPRSADK